ncbi:MAG: copper homeostasis protein CutC [Erysipelotrichaceae bacterium]
MKTTIEICCVGLRDCQHADEQGADRIELCSSMAAGGLTPSLGLFILAKKQCNIPIMVMIRPRGAGFCYSDSEFEVMKEDIKIFLDHQADGIVFGMLDEHKLVDVKRVKELVKLIHSYHRVAVFHRAFDECPSNSTIELLIDCGIDRILTAGGQGVALDHLEKLKMWQEVYGDRIQIQACGNIREDNIQTVIAATNINQIHSACRVFVQDVSDVKCEQLDYSNAYDKVCRDKCAALVAKVR